MLPAFAADAPIAGSASTRDYSLIGANAQRALEQGLASAQWYQTPIPRKQMKELMRRSDMPAIKDTMIWLGVMLISAAAGVYFWGSWLCIPFWVVYGVLYGSATDSRWHECGHGTAFKTRWMNDVVYQIASFMNMKNPVWYRWSHARHHTDTIIVGRDLEILAMRPPKIISFALDFFGVVYGVNATLTMLRHAAGRVSAEENTFIPASEHSKMIWTARIWVLIHAATITLAITLGSWLPLMIIGLPFFYGVWHATMVGLLQHGGLAENVTDHRLNSRTVYMNPVSRFIYWNMNYHVEHHMFPMVPYHALPKLHELVRHDTPAPTPSIWAGYREMLPVFLRQLREPDYYLRRELPPTANPYQDTPPAPGHGADASRTPSENGIRTPAVAVLS